MTNMGGADQASRGAPISIASTISSGASWRRGGSCLCATTGMSIKLSMNCHCGTSTVFYTVWSVSTCHCTTTGMSATLFKNCTCGISTGFRGPVVVQQRTCQQPCPRSTSVQSPRAASAQSGPWAPVGEQQRAYQQHCPRSAPVESPWASAQFAL